jgi:hypothetical protein
MPLTVYSNAPQLPSMQLPANASHVNELNRRLACIEGCNATLADLLVDIKLPDSGAQILVLISKNTDPGLLARIRECSAICPVLWVVPVHAHDAADDGANALPQLPGVRFFRWEVTL